MPLLQIPYCFRLHELSNCVQSAQTVPNRRLSRFSALLISCISDVDFLKRHESSFLKNVAQIKSQHIFFERFFKGQQSYDIFSLVVSKFTLKMPVEMFAYLITKRAVKLYCNESCFSGSIQ